MKLDQAIEILKKHNEWRRGGEGEMVNTVDLGTAIDVVVAEFESVGFELKFCETCFQMTNHIKDQCQKCKTK